MPPLVSTWSFFLSAASIWSRSLRTLFWGRIIRKYITTRIMPSMGSMRSSSPGPEAGPGGAPADDPEASWRKKSMSISGGHYTYGPSEGERNAARARRVRENVAPKRIWIWARGRIVTRGEGTHDRTHYGHPALDKPPGGNYFPWT